MTTTQVTITTGSEKQITWAQQLMDDRIARLTKIADMVGDDQRGALDETIAMLARVTDARPVIDQRGRGAEVVLHVAGVARLGTPEHRIAADAEPKAMLRLTQAQRLSLLGL